MPELPEVEEVRRTLEPHVLGVPIRAIEILRSDFLTPRGAPVGNLSGKAITRTLRHGKKLFLSADGGPALLIHLGMSGRIDCVAAGAPIEKHTHVMMHLANGTDIRQRDPRRFGGMWYYETLQKALAAETAALGPDALTLTAAHLAHWRHQRGRLKQRLLSQKDVAGLGNIYVDEALFMARLHPLQRVARIPAEQVHTLVEAILQVLHRSIQSGGTTLRDYRNVSDQPGAFAPELQCYGRAEEPCVRCGQALRSRVIATRTTTYCPSCQRCR